MPENSRKQNRIHNLNDPTNCQSSVKGCKGCQPPWSAEWPSSVPEKSAEKRSYGRSALEWQRTMDIEGWVPGASAPLPNEVSCLDAVDHNVSLGKTNAIWPPHLDHPFLSSKSHLPRHLIFMHLLTHTFSHTTYVQHHTKTTCTLITSVGDTSRTEWPMHSTCLLR